MISQKEYDRLNEAATAFAATVIDQAGFSEFAEGAYRRLGELSARHYLEGDTEK